MIGQYATPPPIVRRMLGMVEPTRFAQRGDRVLDPGCGEGAFLLPILEDYATYAASQGHPLSWIVSRIRGVELDAKPLAVCRQAAARILVQHGFRPTATDLAALVVESDFTQFRETGFNLVIGNPPYVRLEGLLESDRRRYRRQFESAINRYDLYFLFFEQGLRLLSENGQLLFITPQKFTQVWSGSGLRRLLATREIREIVVLAEDAFPNLITYPAITHLVNRRPASDHRIKILHERKGGTRHVSQSLLAEEPWYCVFGEVDAKADGLTLSDVCSRIGVGVATGADAVFEVTSDEARMLPPEYVKATLAGRDLPSKVGEKFLPGSKMVFPYDRHGGLVQEGSLGSAAAYLGMAHHREKLVKRSCHAKGRRAWYEYHERPRPTEFEAAKIVVQDIQKVPVFHIDRTAAMPKHSIYYIIPRDPAMLEPLVDYLNSDAAGQWLKAHCMSAAGGHLRIQSRTLAQLPLPVSFGKHRPLVEAAA